MDISKGRYWDKAWSLVNGCTPCSPGCENCWAASMAHRFVREGEPGHDIPILTTERGGFNGVVIPRQDRLDIPLRRKKPTVYSVWNDLFWKGVDRMKTIPDNFIDAVWKRMSQCHQHTFLILTKRPHRMLEVMTNIIVPNYGVLPNVWPGCTICNQQEADEKIPIFLQVPGKKFLSIEPMLGRVNLLGGWWTIVRGDINAVILGGETGPGARPMHPEWVRSVRDQCAAVGVPFFLKYMNKNDGRVLDGKTYDDLPWIPPEGMKKGGGDEHKRDY